MRFPSIAEMYSRVTDEQESIADELEDVFDEQADVREQFDDLKDEMKSDPSLDWQKEERIEAALERQEKVADEVTEVANAARRPRRRDERDRPRSRSTRSRRPRRSRDCSTRSRQTRCASCSQKIRDAMSDINPEQLSTAMEQMTLTQDDYLRRLEQTLNLLRRAKAEQELADVANRAEDLAEREGRIAEEASQNPTASAAGSLPVSRRRSRRRSRSSRPTSRRPRRT